MSRALTHITHRAGVTASQTGANIFGVIKSYNPDNHTCDVELDDGVIARDLPICTMAAGSTSVRYAPVSGQMAWLCPDSHDTDALVVTGFGHNDLNRPADSVSLQPGEIVISSAAGVLIHLAADGSLSITAKTAAVTIPCTAWKGDISLDGKLVATGNVESAAEVKDKRNTLDHLRQTYDDHTHHVQGIGGPTAKPDEQD